MRIWGLFFNGLLEYWTFSEEPDGKGNMKSVNMTGARYNYFVNFSGKIAAQVLPYFSEGEQVPLIKDFQKFLR